MVNRLLRLLSIEIKGLHEAAYLLAFFALASQLLGLVRDRLLAASFGAGASLDVYYAAFRIPDFIFVTISSLVSVSVLIPFLIEKLGRSKEEGIRFINTIFTLFFLLIVVVSAVLFVAIPYLIPIFLPGFINSPHIGDLIILTRILLLSPILLGISNLFGSITQVYKQFALYAVSPLLYNFGIIVGVVGLYPLFGITGLAWGVVFGAMLHAAIQIPSLLTSGLFPKFVTRLDLASIKTVATLSVPRTIAMGANQMSTFFLVSFASLMATGSIAVFTFAWNLQSVPMGIIGMSYSLAAFPTLSGLFTKGHKEQFVRHIGEAARHIVFWSMPIMVLFIVIRAQIVRVILGAGHFSWSDTKLTAAALALFAVSVAAQSLLLLIVRGYYAASDTKTPLYVNMFCSALIVGCAYLFVTIFNTYDVVRFFFESLLKVDGLDGTSVLMLPLAYSVGTILNLVLHLVSFERHHGSVFKMFSRTLFESFGASLIMGYVAYVFLGVYGNVFALSTLVGIFLQGLCAGLTGIGAGIIILYLLKSRELDQVWKTLHKKIWKANIVVAEQQEL